MKTQAKIAAGAVTALLLLGACGGSSDQTDSSGVESPAAPSASTSEDEATGTATAGAEVELQTFRFEPGEIEVEVGETVTWINNDDILHTVTSGVGQKQGVPGVSKDKDAKPDGLFDQEMDGTGATFEFTFDEAGSFDYFCAIHPGMTGKVTVE